MARKFQSDEATAAEAVVELFRQAYERLRQARQIAESAGLHFEDYCQPTLLAMYEEGPTGFVIYEGGSRAERYAACWNDQSNGESTMIQVVPQPSWVD
jgi:hypothetical protein